VSLVLEGKNNVHKKRTGHLGHDSTFGGNFILRGIFLQTKVFVDLFKSKVGLITFELDQKDLGVASHSDFFNKFEILIADGTGPVELVKNNNTTI
jgi:hypothetical protein